MITYRTTSLTANSAILCETTVCLALCIQTSCAVIMRDFCTCFLNFKKPRATKNWPSIRMGSSSNGDRPLLTPLQLIWSDASMMPKLVMWRSPSTLSSGRHWATWPSQSLSPFPMPKVPSGAFQLNCVSTSQGWLFYLFMFFHFISTPFYYFAAYDAT